MKPVKIVMQCFGAYLGRSEVDFLKLAGAPLFLISGPTGSGKTTLLDAMSCALYGRATGALRRDWKELRSTGASQETPTVVEFEFTLGAERYRFVRTFSERMVKKRSGATELKQESTAECFVWAADGWRLLGNRAGGGPEGEGTAGLYLRAVFPGDCAASGGISQAAHRFLQ